MARKMTLIVVTDAACWLPIILLGVVSLAGVTIPPQVSDGSLCDGSLSASCPLHLGACLSGVSWPGLGLLFWLTSRGASEVPPIHGKLHRVSGIPYEH